MRGDHGDRIELSGRALVRGRNKKERIDDVSHLLGEAGSPHSISVGRGDSRGHADRPSGRRLHCGEPPGGAATYRVGRGRWHCRNCLGLHVG